MLSNCGPPSSLDPAPSALCPTPPALPPLWFTLYSPSKLFTEEPLKKQSAHFNNGKLSFLEHVQDYPHYNKTKLSSVEKQQYEWLGISICGVITSAFWLLCGVATRCQYCVSRVIDVGCDRRELLILTLTPLPTHHGYLLHQTVPITPSADCRGTVHTWLNHEKDLTTMME